MRPTAVALVVLLAPSVAGPSLQGATVAFEALTATSVPAGTPVEFNVRILLEILPELNAADVLIGVNGAADLTFYYSSEWDAAMLSVTPPAYDVGYYDHSVFVGGNNALQSTQTPILVGTVSIDTSGMVLGSYSVRVDHEIDGFSLVALGMETETLSGESWFQIIPEPSVVWFPAILLLVLRRSTRRKRQEPQ